MAVFENAKDTYVCIPLFTKNSPPEQVKVTPVVSSDELDLMEYAGQGSYYIPTSRLNSDSWVLSKQVNLDTFHKISAMGIPLGEYVDGPFCRGVTTGLNAAFCIDGKTRDDLISSSPSSGEIIKPLLKGQDIRKWNVRPKNSWIIFPRRGIDIDRYPAVLDHLSGWKEDLTPKRASKDKRGRKPGRYKWYEIQDEVAYYAIFDGPKIIFPDIAKNPRFYFDPGGNYLTNTAYAIGGEDLYLLGILNSKVFWFSIANISIPFGTRGGKFRYRLIYQYMSQVPIRAIDFSDPSDKAKHDLMVDLVESMLALHKQLAGTKTDHERTNLQRQIDSTDSRIDRLVYELYDLTEEEIAVVEEATA